MLPDVIDEAALKRDVRREELFYAFFVFGNKFGSGVTLGISTAIYKSVKACHKLTQLHTPTHFNEMSLVTGCLYSYVYYVMLQIGWELYYTHV